MSIISISGKIGAGKDEVAKIIQRATNYYFEIRRFADSLKDIVCILIGCTREQLEDRDFKEKELGEEWRIWYMTHYKLSNNNSEGRIGKIYSSEEELLSYEDSEFFKNLKLDGYQIVSKLLTPRKLLQLLGTECGRQILHPNIWVNALMSEYKVEVIPNENYGSNKTKPKNWVITREEEHEYLLDNSHWVYKEEVNVISPNWIIPDVRFPNELKAVKDRGGITIRVNRPDFVENTLTGEKFPVKVYKKEHKSETALDTAEFDYVIDNSGSLGDLEEKVLEILRKEKLI